MVVPTDIMLDNVRLLRELKKRENKHKDPFVSMVIDANNFPKSMDILEENTSNLS